MNRKLAIGVSVVVFLSFVILLEGNGNIIHGDAYDAGAQWTPAILQKDLCIKIALYQVVIFTLLFIHKNFFVWLWTETFCWSCTQDLFFYGWRGFVFPEGNWSWMPLYNFFGHWNTVDQLLLSSIVLTLVSIMPILVKILRKKDGCCIWYFVPKSIYHGRNRKMCYYEANCLYCVIVTALKVIKKRLEVRMWIKE